MNGSSAPKAIAPSMTPSDASLPVHRSWLVNGFLRFSKGMVRRNFHTFAVDASDLQGVSFPSELGILVYGNHASWWDPIVASILRMELFPNRKMYAPIERNALKQYPILGQMGFYGIDLQTLSGAAAFLKKSRTILQSSNASLWMTPEGKFTDVRDRESPFLPGLAHLVSQCRPVILIPLAVEYPFWEERYPEILARFGPPMLLASPDAIGKDRWQTRLREALAREQQILAELSITRNTDRFSVLVRGRDRNRSLLGSVRRWYRHVSGKPLPAQHGDKFSSSPGNPD